MSVALLLEAATSEQLLFVELTCFFGLVACFILLMVIADRAAKIKKLLEKRQ